MDKFLEEMFGAIIDEILNGEPTKEDEKLSDSDLDKKEFKSLVSDEEKKAIEEVRTAVKNLARVHKKGLIDQLEEVHKEQGKTYSELLKIKCLSEIFSR